MWNEAAIAAQKGHGAMFLEQKDNIFADHALQVAMGLMLPDKYLVAIVSIVNPVNIQMHPVYLALVRAENV